MVGSANNGFDLPTLEWVQDNTFIALDNVTLQMFMEFPVHSWNDFIVEDRLEVMNLKCMLPSGGHLIPRQVPRVEEFDAHWPSEWRASM